MTRKLRILLAKFGDGYEAAMLKLASSCSEAGFEVIYTQVQEPEAIVASAIQESVDHIGITTLPGAGVESFRQLFELLSEEGVSDIRVTAGGIFPEEDVARVRAMGLLDFYPRNVIYDKIAQWKAAYADTA